MTPVEGAGRHIDTPAQFAGGEGAADPRLVAALGEGRGDAVLALLTEGVRLLVPIVAVRDDVDADGADTSSHMASVSLVQPDGRRGMLAFTSLESRSAPAMSLLRPWPKARTESWWISRARFALHWMGSPCTGWPSRRSASAAT